MPQALFHRISIKRLQCTGIVGADIIYFPDSIVAGLTAGVVVELSEEINVYRYEAKRSNILPRLLKSAGPFPGTSVVGKGSSNPSRRELRSFVSKNATFQRLHPDPGMAKKLERPTLNPNFDELSTLVTPIMELQVWSM